MLKKSKSMKNLNPALFGDVARVHPLNNVLPVNCASLASEERLQAVAGRLKGAFSLVFNNS